MVEAPETIEWLYNQNKVVLVDRIGRLERQIAELRAELINRVNYWSELYSKEYHRAESAEAENARLRALPLKDEVERLAEFFIDERDDDMLICAKDDFAVTGSRCIARRPKLLSNDEWRGTAQAIVAALSRLRDGWREITEDDHPPLDTDVIMGCWETSPKRHWATEIGHYGSKRGGWIRGWITHWLPLDRLPAAPSNQGGDRG